MLVYEVLPSRMQRLRLVFGKRTKEHDQYLGFLGISGTVSSRKVLLKSKHLFDSKAQVITLQLLKFPGNLVLALFELEADYSISQWSKLVKPHRSEFYELAKWSHKLPFRALYSSASVILVNPALEDPPPQIIFIRSDRDFVAENLGTRVALTSTVEQAILERVNSLNFKSQNFGVVNGLISMINNWPDVWSTTSFSAQKTIDSLGIKLHSRAEVQALMVKLKSALNNEQRRIAWAAGSGIAIANLLAQTIADSSRTWLPWIALAVISTAIYFWKPFSK